MKKEASRQQNSVIFEGMTSLNAILKSYDSNNSRKIITVWFDSEKKRSKSRELSFIQRCSQKYGFDVKFADRDYIDGIAIGNSHGGIIAECTEKEIPRLSEDYEIIPDGFYIMIEGIEDPYNFGYALRTLYAAGADGVILPERNWLSAAGVVCRASAGASELLSSFVSNSVKACEYFKKRGYKIASAGIRDSVPAFDADLKKPLLLIVGGEKRGISAKVLSLSDMVIRLDYGREFSGSLSAASAASILAYEVFRQNR